ncbi:MAG: CapA family protein [Chakrabartia sp.]
MKRVIASGVAVAMASALYFMGFNGQSRASAPPAAGPEAKPATNPSYRIVGVGDVMMGSDWPLPILDPRVTPEGSAADVVGPEIAGLFKDADIAFANFEGTLHNSDVGSKLCQNPKICFTFRSPTFHADYLAKAGFDLVSNANNHARDFGETGRKATYANLTAAGLAVSAADQDGMRIGQKTLPDGTRVALLAFGHNVGLMPVTDLSRVTELVREASAASDILIVSCHIGAEGASRQNITRENETFIGENRGNPFAFARTAVDAGADIVLCHGPHVARAVEVYKGRFIAYSLGNFWTYGQFNLNGPNGLAPIVDLRVDKAGALQSARIVSARQTRPGGPVLDPTHEAARTIAELTASDLPEAGIQISATGEISWPGKP